MSEGNSKLAKVTGQALFVLGILLVVTDIAYLPVHDQVDIGVANLGLVMYGFATAGGAFAAWGYIMLKMDSSSVSKQSVFMGTAIGLFLMGLMRLVTAAFPPELLDAALPVLVGEGVAFIALAVLFVKKGKA